MRLLFLILVLFSFLNSKEGRDYCPEKVTTLFENSYEKIFEFKNSIYKIVKGDNRRDTIFMILDERSRKYIVIDSKEEEDVDSDDDILELMQ